MPAGFFLLHFAFYFPLASDIPLKALFNCKDSLWLPDLFARRLRVLFSLLPALGQSGCHWEGQEVWKITAAVAWQPLCLSNFHRITKMLSLSSKPIHSNDRPWFPRLLLDVIGFEGLPFFAVSGRIRLAKMAYLRRLGLFWTYLEWHKKRSPILRDSPEHKASILFWYYLVVTLCPGTICLSLGGTEVWKITAAIIQTQGFLPDTKQFCIGAVD